MYEKGWVIYLEQAVTIKGTQSGIILVLHPTVSFDQLSVAIAEKFKENATFLGRHTFGLAIRGRKLSEDEIEQVVKIIEENSFLKIGCVIDEESDLEIGFKRALGTAPVAEVETTDKSSENDYEVADEDTALIYRGNLRSGQDISSQKSIIVLGDVKPGANVTSFGSIFILGELRGNAFAGAGGDRNSVIMALDLSPIQVRIADAIAISPDAEKGAKLKVKKKKFLSSGDKEPEVAYIENDHIVKTGYGASFLRQFYEI